MDNSEYIDKLYEFAIVKKIPLSVTIEMTEICNFECVHCYLENYRAKNMLSFEKIEKYATELKKMGCLYIRLTGGEVFSHPDFDKVYEMLIKMGFVVTILTNGSLIKKKQIELLARYKPKRVEITLYGKDSKTYLSVTNRNCFDDVIKNVILMKNAGIPLLIKMFVVKENLESYKWIENFAKEKNLPFKADSIIVSDIVAQKAHQIDCLQRIELVERQMLQLYDINPKLNEILSEECKHNLFKCGVGKTTFWIMASGKVRPCNFLFNVEYDTEKYSLEFIWKMIIKFVSTFEMKKDMCCECKLYWFCDMCPAKANVLHGSYQVTKCDELFKKSAMMLYDNDKNLEIK